MLLIEILSFFILLSSLNIYLFIISTILLIILLSLNNINVIFARTKSNFENKSLNNNFKPFRYL